MTGAYGDGGGIAAFNRTLLSALCELGHDVCVVSYSASESRATEDLEWHPVSGKKALAARVLVLRSRERFDAVIIGHINLVPLAFLLPRTPYWVVLHGIDAWDSPPFFHRQLCRRARIVSAVSDHTRQRVLRWQKTDENHVRVLPNTVDLQRYRPTNDRVRDLRHRYRLDGEPLLLTVGRLGSAERYKGHAEVLQALPELLNRFPELIYVVAGSGDDQRRLEAVAAANGVFERTRFLGAVPHEELPALYSLADLFVMPSSGEGFGIVYLEAAACNTPFLAGATDAGAEVATELGQPSVNAQCREELIESLVDSLSRRAELTKGLRDRVRDRYGYAVFRSGVEKLLGVLAGNSKSSKVCRS